MKKFLNSLFTVLLIVGIAGTFASFKDAMLVLKGETIDLNKTTLSDFNEDKIITGELYDLYGYLCTEEVTRTTYGIKTGSTETDFWLFSNSSKDQIADSEMEQNPVLFVYSTGSKDEIETIEKLNDEWYEYEEAISEWYYSEDASEENAPAPPVTTLKFTGKICDINDAEILKYRNDLLSEFGFEETDYDTYCAAKMVKFIDVKATKIIFFAAIGVMVVGLVGLILIFVKSRKAKSEELY